MFLISVLTATVKAAAAVHQADVAASEPAVSKSVDTVEPLPDQVVTFSIQILNTGAISATNGTPIDDLDSNLTFIGPVSIEAKAGDTVIFTYIVTNDGRVSLNEIKAIEVRPGVYRSLDLAGFTVLAP